MKQERETLLQLWLTGVHMIAGGFFLALATTHFAAASHHALRVAPTPEQDDTDDTVTGIENWLRRTR